MASVWLTTRTTKHGERRYRVEYRLGGREAPTRYGGSFKRKADADERKRWINGELAARRVPDLRTLEQTAPKTPTLSDAYEAWQRSRVDVSAATALSAPPGLDRAHLALGDRSGESAGR